MGPTTQLLASALGILAFLYPFLTTTRTVEAPLLAAALAALAIAAILLEAQGGALGAKTAAALGVLVALTSVLRFVEVAIPGPGGFTPMWPPIILAGYVFGARFGFLLGALTLLASALITGGVGPWLPYQMFAAGWMGLTAGLLGRLRLDRTEQLVLCAFGALWGLLYGAVMNLYSWPFAAWTPGTNLADTLAHYAAFYVATSLAWDVAAAVGNVLLIALLGPALVRAFARFQRRFAVEIEGT